MNEEYVNKLINKLSEAEHAYYVLNSPIMSDGEYDKLFKELKQIENENSKLIFSYSPTQRVTGTPDTAFQAVAHKQRMYSLDNSENIEEVKKWIEKIEKITDLSIFPITVEPKIDGLAISLFYNDGLLFRGLTRGDGIVGEDVTHNIKTIKNTIMEDTNLKSIEIIDFVPIDQWDNGKGKKISLKPLEYFSKVENLTIDMEDILVSGDWEEKEKSFFDFENFPNFQNLKYFKFYDKVFKGDYASITREIRAL